MSQLRANLWLLAGAGAFALGGPATAQDDTDNEPRNLIEEVVVIGTNVDRSAFDTPTSVAVVNEENMRLYSAGSFSQADLLAQVPGITTEGGGGEVATNFRTRGLNAGGAGFEYGQLLSDGMPVKSIFGLNSSAVDFFFRADLGIERVEYTAGSVSNLLGVGAPAAYVNYVSKTGGDVATGTLQAEIAEDGRYRGDFAFQGPISDDTFYAVSGYARVDDGPFDQGLPTEGFSLRGNLKKDFSDGSGFVQVLGTFLDDRVQFFLPTVLDAQSRNRIRGNDGRTVFTLNAPSVANLIVPTPEGRTEFDADDGFTARGGSIGVVFEKDFGNDWTINAKAKWSRYESASNFFIAGAGGQVPVAQDAFITNQGVIVPAGFEAQFTFAETGQALAAGDLVLENLFIDRERDTSDSSFEVNLTKMVDVGGLNHNFTFGAFMARGEAINNQRNVQYLHDFTNAPELVDLTLVDPTGTLADQQYTLGGIVQAPSGFANQDRSGFRRALFVADQIESADWALDVAFRFEEMTAQNQFEGTTTLSGVGLVPNPVMIDTGNGPELAPIDRQSFGNNRVFDGDATASKFSFAVGGLYRLNDSLNLFGTYSSSAFFPQPQGTGGQISATGDIVFYEPEDLVQAEIGVKYNYDRFSGTASAYYVTLDDRNRVDFNPGQTTPIVFSTDTRTVGLQADVNFDVNDWLTLNANATWGDQEFTDSDVQAIIGNSFPRFPEILVNFAGYVNVGNFDASVVWNWRDDTFQDEGEGVPLDSFSVVRLSAGYTFDFDGEDRLRIGLNIANAFDSDGLQEGNPRAGIVQVGDPSANFFIGRPVLPRRAALTITYDF